MDTPHKIAIAVSTVIYGPPAPGVPLSEQGMITFDLDVLKPGCSHPLSWAEAIQISAWLRAAAEAAEPTEAQGVWHASLDTDEARFEARTAPIGEYCEPDDPEPESGVDLVAGERPVRLIIFQSTPEVFCMSASYATALADAFDQAREVLRSAPLLVLEEHEVGRIQGEGGNGEPVEVTLEVEQFVDDLDRPRITLDFLGTWWIDPEALQLAEGLEAAAVAADGVVTVALCEPQRPDDPWMRVRSVGGKVEVRLFDELVEDSQDDGVLLLDRAAALAFAGLLREALRFKAAETPYIFVPPEPFERLVITL